MAKENTTRHTFRIETEKLNTLHVLAAKEHIPVSQLVRRYIDKGMEIDGHLTQMDTIRMAVREEVAAQLKPRLERAVQINYKGSLYAIQTAYLCALALEGLVPMSKQMNFREAIERATKAAVSVMDNQGIRRDEGFLEDLWTDDW